jgi:hypothetical protein
MAAKKKRPRISRGKPLTDKEVQALRDRAKAYREKGGEYLEPGEFKL